MSNFISGLGNSIESMLNYRETLGYSKSIHTANLMKFDCFCADYYPEADCLTKEMVLEWLDEQITGLPIKAAMLRLLGKYLTALGKDSFILPNGMIYEKKSFSPYVFSDRELSELFYAADTIAATPSEPFLPDILPVLLRLIYTSGLRPNEGRELLHKNINFETGEILITNTKRKKDRIVVMSGDMLRLCKEYQKLRNIFARGSEYFFPSWGGDAFTPNQLGRFFKECWARANPDIPKGELPKVRVYDLRHRFASAVLNRWLDSKQVLSAKLPYLRAYMGHSTMKETAYYIHLLPENLVKSAGIDWKEFDEIVPDPLGLEVELWPQ